VAERVPRRRAYQAGGRPIRLSVTLTEDEHCQLGELAQERGVSIATLLVESALRAGAAPNSSRQPPDAGLPPLL
jgi:hypothetical protein